MLLDNSAKMRVYIFISIIAFSLAFPSLNQRFPNKILRTDEETIFSEETEDSVNFNEDTVNMLNEINWLENKTNSFSSKKKLNKESVQKHMVPVCGVEDVDEEYQFNINGSLVSLGNEIRKRSKRYVRGHGKFKKRRLKYIILKFTKDLSRSQIDIIMSRALNAWAIHTNLEFEETLNKEEAQIKISFEVGSHGHWPPFWPGDNVIGHASYPVGASTFVHFNDEWIFSNGRLSLNQRRRKHTELFRVAVHEFGHNLGLAHCRTKQPAVMCNTFDWDQKKGLHANDIAGIQSIYGKRKKPRKRTKPPIKVCSASFSFDAIHFDHRTEAIYGIKRRFYWKINDFGVMKGYPKKVRSLWKMFPGNIDASFHSKFSKKTYFFKGNMVWRYRGGNLDAGFPKPMSRYNIPSNVDAAISIAGRHSYVIKGNFTYQFNERPKRGQRLRKTRINKLWPGAPSNIDAAIQWRDGNIYLFKGYQYWRFSGQRNAKGLRPFPGWKRFKGIIKPFRGNYPKNMQKHWIGCKKRKSKTSLNSSRKSRASSGRLRKN